MLLLSGLLMNNIVYSQDKKDLFLYKRIPVVKYAPRDFLATINDAFVHSPEYLDICIENEDTLYVQDRFGKSTVYRRDFFEVNDINTKLLFRPDSVFFISIKDEAISLPNIPIYRIYGIKKNGEYLFSLTHGRDKLNSFADLLKIRYGSIGKFREFYLDYIRGRLKLMGDDYNGISIYSKDKQSMESFLKKDYLMNEKFNPADTISVLNQFISLISSYTLLKDKQEDLLRSQLLKNIYREPMVGAKEQEILHYVFSDIILYQIEISHVLSSILTRQQYEEVSFGLMCHNKQRVKYVRYLRLYKTPESIRDDYPMPSYNDMLKETADILLGGVNGSSNKK